MTRAIFGVATALILLESIPLALISALLDKMEGSESDGSARLIKVPLHTRPNSSGKKDVDNDALIKKCADGALCCARANEVITTSNIGLRTEVSEDMPCPIRDALLGINNEINSLCVQ